MVETTRAREATLPPPLLLTKLHSPVLRDQTVVRDRLLERLSPGPGVKLTVVAAPAGYGKTTLLGTWCEKNTDTRPVAWLTLDEGDNDPMVLWLHIVEALRRAQPELGGGKAAPANASRDDPVARRLVNELAERDDIVLILDDFHRLSRGPARDAVAWLIEHAPATFHVVLGTRNEPGLPLGVMRAHGELLELRADELGFTPEEADALLNGRLGLGLARADVDLLVEKVEGWPAGIYLAGLSLATVSDRHAFLKSFGGTSRYVVDFLVDEVLDAHDLRTQSLMLRCSILERLSGPLCDAVLEAEDSGRLLSELARTNLFLLPLDGAGEWYRFHHLFAQLLRVELEHRAPDMSRTLHRRAYAWYGSQGAFEEAIRHAQLAGAFAEARQLVAQVWLETASSGRLTTVLGWVDGFPAEVARADPSLALVRAWISSLSGDREGADAAIALLETLRWPEEVPLPDGSGSLEASLAALRAAFPWGDIERAHAHALRAIELVAPDSTLRPATTWALASSYYYLGDLDGADWWFEQTVEVGLRRERWLATASALAYRSLIAGERGQVEEQFLLAGEAADIAREQGLDEICGEVHIAGGVACEARGELEDARSYLDQGVAALRSGQPLDYAMALLHQARARERAGLREAASAAIREAAATIAACPAPGVLGERLDALERAPLERGGDRDLSGRELIVLRMLKGPLSERDIGRELYLSHNTVHSHTKSIYRKLGVSSRRQAVQRAATIGLI